MVVVKLLAEQRGLSLNLVEIVRLDFLLTELHVLKLLEESHALDLLLLLLLLFASLGVQL